MAVSALSKACAKAIKAWGKSIGLDLRVNGGSGKAQYVGARCRSIQQDHRAPLAWEGEFPLESRVKALKIIYGEKDFTASGNAGNIDQHSMIMRNSEWVTFFKGTAFEIEGQGEPA